MTRLLLMIVAFNLAVLILSAGAVHAIWLICPQPLPPVATLMIGAAGGGALLSSALQLIKARFDP